MDFKSYFHNQYQGGESFIEEVIIPIFGEDKYEDAYEEDMLESNPELETMAASTGISQIIRLGRIDIPLNPTDVFDITVKDHVQMERNRVAIQLLVRRIMSTYSSAFMIFHYDDTTKWDWRFTFCSKQGKNSDTTDSKRYTFLLGPNQSCRTAAENFTALYKKGGKIELDDIIRAFDVEALSKEFFEKYKQHYEKFCNFVYEHKNDAEYFGSEFATCEEKRIRDYVKKLLGRIVFLHFLQKKGWMGVPVDGDWGEGNLNFMKSLFDNASKAQKENYLDEMLEPLFEDVNTKRTDDISTCGEFKVPYLNGGLFERDEMDKPKSRFSKELFANLFQFFYEYNFTIDENDPNDAQVGVDPEMLGRIFENLLEDNKDKGAFYTPKEIVQYMCKESLIAYLQTDITDEGTKEAVRQFVTTYDVETLGSNEFASIIDKMLKDVKICDPAIGSGAFPMGLLKELFLCRGAIEHFDNAAEIKRHIIQNNIYGVDIERGAVDIARLRFWLALIVDEVTPHALPNMDFKIMQGNSLLEQCKDINGKYVDLSDLGYKKTKKDIKRGVQLSWFENAADLSKKQFSIKMNQYFNEDDHARKVALRKDIKDIVQQQLCDLEYNVDLSTIEDISATSEFFLWHTWFADVFEKGGFDIVIGNPPYIDSETMSKNMPLQRSLYSQLFDYAKGNWDLFIIFIERSIKLLKKRGIFSNIIPNKLIAAKYALPLRQYMATKTVIEIRDYSRIDVFENVAVYPITFILRNDSSKVNTKFTIMSNRVDVRQSNESPSIELKSIDYWDVFFTDSPIFNIMKKLRDCKQLKNCDVEVLGAATVSDAYEIKKFVYDNNCVHGFKLVNSGTIDPYTPLWGIKTCRYIKEGYLHPKVVGNDLSKYSEVRYCQASSPKIIVASMTTRYEAMLDTCGEFIAGKSTTIILGNINILKMLVAFINSKLASFWLNIQFNSLKMSGGAINVGRNELMLLPIASENPLLVKTVDSILSAKKSNPQADTSALETEIDRLVYDLYGLTEAEIKIVEGQNS